MVTTSTVEKEILRALADRGRLTPSEIMAMVGLSRRAATKAIRALAAQGAVSVVPDDPSRLQLDPERGVAVAVHVNRRELRVAAVDVNGALIAERREGVEGWPQRTAQIARLVAECAGSRIVQMAVVGVPGIVDAEGHVYDEEGPDGGLFRSALAARLGCPVRLENETNLAAVAESRIGVGHGRESFVLLHLGSGFGAGIVLDGKLRRGASGYAGEVEHLPHPALPIAAPVLNDLVVSDLALTLGGDTGLPLAGQLDACAAGDEVAASIVDTVVQRYFLVAATIALVCDPEVFVLGGEAKHPAFVAAAERCVEQYAPLLTMHMISSALGPEATLAGAVLEVSDALRGSAVERLTTP